MAEKSNGSSSTSYTLSTNAYAVPLLHAAKNHSSGVIGLFLGRKQPSSTASTSTTVEVVDAVPCIHLYPSLSMTMEIAHEQVEAFVGGSDKGKGLEVVGMYEARVGGKDSGFSRAGEKLLRTWRQHRDGFFGFVLDNERIAAGEWPYQVYTPADSPSVQLKALPSSPNGPPQDFSIPSVDLPKQVLAAIRDKHVHRSVGDLDDHLEDASIAWLSNTAAKEALNAALP